MPYTADEEKTRVNLIKHYGQKTGTDIFNKLRAEGKLGQASKDRMEARSAATRRGERSAE